MNPTTEPFELPILVQDADIDQLGHVNNVVYVRWIQDVAIAHWQSAASPAEQANLLWVVVRHEIDYKRPAFLQDRIIARTWVGAASHYRFDRHTEILRAADRRCLVSARTVWCPIDAQTGKPADVTPEIRARFSTPEPPAIL
ncbi:acyl-CoA thioesterase [Pedosphaera parvula]|uniref:Thioesterase superfamily protein n=1 Tax=Pedosphaera parvula (strain Ellin514) TaxID=320771 RepID=B9XGE9_PEDPL|nr:acyl-CoA thioesterase [Pedosphaera parvula]EEF61000.1 thioesterase superfamily protein [Pedosphaera parvula Ellin514]